MQGIKETMSLSLTAILPVVNPMPTATSRPKVMAAASSGALGASTPW
jgi:hypothetical protein